LPGFLLLGGRAGDLLGLRSTAAPTRRTSIHRPRPEHGRGGSAIADAALNRLGGSDIIVNNAGGARTYPDRPLAIEVDAWQDALDVNFLSAARFNAARLPQMP
jgi:hypothetical protein